MQTQQVALVSKQWVQVYQGPTNGALSLSLNGEYDRCFIAVGNTPPTFVGGHMVTSMMEVTLGAGDTLYAYTEATFVSPVYAVVTV